jgi:multidrug transporter EmrE-like cation transporter
VARENFGDEVRLLDAEVPYITLESALWSVGIGSGLCVAALAWAVWRRPRIRPAGYILLGWLVLGERLEPRHWLGLGLILAGLAMIDGRIFRRR